MAITIKKSKLTLKAPVAEAPITPEEGATGEGAAEAAAGAGTQAASVPVKSGPGAFRIITFILVLLSFGIFTSLVVLQYLEWSYYHQPPTAFPEFIPQYGALPSVATAPKVSEVPEALPEALKPAPLTAPAPAPAAATTPVASNTTPTTTASPPPRPKTTRPPRPADMPDGV